MFLCVCIFVDDDDDDDDDDWFDIILITVLIQHTYTRITIGAFEGLLGCSVDWFGPMCQIEVHILLL